VSRSQVITRPGRALTRGLVAVLVALLAVGAVVALVLLGSPNSKRASAGRHANVTLANPRPTPSTAPGAATLTYVNTTVQLPFGGQNRSYLLSRPAERSARPLPIIIVLHGRDATSAQEAQRTNFTSVVSPSILIYPNGYQQSWNAGGCCGPAASGQIDDLGFIRFVLRQVQDGQPDASKSRAYLAGYSNGGKMALAMACHDAGDFAGIAVYGATDAAPCPGRAPSAVLIMAGTTDPDLPANSKAPLPLQPDGFAPPTQNEEVDSYRLADGCSSIPVVTSVGSVTLTSWVSCMDNQRVGQAVFAGDGHGWPAGSPTSPSGEGVAWAWFTSLGA